MRPFLPEPDLSERIHDAVLGCRADKTREIRLLDNVRIDKNKPLDSEVKERL